MKTIASQNQFHVQRNSLLLEHVPFVSVIMPVRNEAQFIKRSLGAVLDQTYPHTRLEVIVADGMSEDNTRQVILEMESDLSITILDNFGRTVSSGFNIALKSAHGEYIVRVDGHTIIAPDYIEECVHALIRSSAACVGGRMTAVGTSPFGIAVAVVTSSPFGVGGSRFHYSVKEELVDSVYMGAWNRSVFERNGHFDERLVRNQDDEFSYRLRSNGEKILLVPTIRSQYYNRSTPRLLFKQYFQYGFYKVIVMRKHPTQIKPRHLIPASLVACLIILPILAIFSLVLGLIWCTISLLYFLLVLAISAYIWYQNQHISPILLCCAFIILHFGYGSGFVIGIASVIPSIRKLIGTASFAAV